MKAALSWVLLLTASAAVRPVMAAPDGGAIEIRSIAAYNQASFGDQHGDRARGQRIAMQACSQCHGAQGNAVSRAFPNLSAQLPEYLVAQLMLFKTGERRSPIMQPVAQNLSAADMLDAAAFYSSQAPGKPYLSNNAELMGRGEKLYREGDLQRGTPACIHCHGTTGGAIAPIFPRIGGQSPDYLEFVLGVLKTKRFVIHEAYVMKAILTNLTLEDIKAVATYTSTLTVANPEKPH